MYVFAYGSLLHPASVRRTLPGFDGGFDALTRLPANRGAAGIVEISHQR